MIGGDGVWLQQLEAAAERSLPAPVFHYIRQGSGEGTTAAAAIDAWRSVRFLPRVLTGTSSVDPHTEVLGQRLGAPVAVAPTTLQRLVHPLGELAMARACASADSLMVVSSNAGTPFAEIAETGVHWWLQAYLTQDRSLAEPLLASAVESGARAIVLTVDTPVVATKFDEGPTVWQGLDPANLRVNFPGDVEGTPGSEKAVDLAPADIAWLGERTGVPIVVKGVLRPDDALACVEAGASAVWVSNHGGRQFDRAVATASALPAVVAAVGDRAQVYVDGGLRNGADVAAALALGADCAFLGRQPLWALVDGEAAVLRMHREVVRQLVELMLLGGVATPRDLSSILARTQPKAP